MTHYSAVVDASHKESLEFLTLYPAIILATRRQHKHVVNTTWAYYQNLTSKCGQLSHGYVSSNYATILSFIWGLQVQPCHTVFSYLVGIF